MFQEKQHIQFQPESAKHIAVQHHPFQQDNSLIHNRVVAVTRKKG